MSLEVLMERLQKAGIPFEICGEGRTSALVVDGMSYPIVGDTVHL